MSAQIIPFAEAAAKVRARRRADIRPADWALAVACCFPPVCLTLFALRAVFEALIRPSGDRS